MISFNISASLWNRWFRFAILNSFFFVLISLVNWNIFQNDLSSSLAAPVIYFFFSILIFVQMVISGGALAPIAWFVLGSGIFFGAGTAIWGLQLCENLACSMAGGKLLENINRVNMLNASSSLLILIFASKLSFQNRIRRIPDHGLVNFDWVWIHKLSIPFVAVAVALNLYFFPVAESFMIRTFLSKLNFVIPLFMVLSGVNWRKFSKLRGSITLFLIAGVLTVGLFSFSKSAFVIPVLCLLSGFWIAQRSFLSIVIPGIVLVLFYGIFLVPSVSSGRLDFRYDDAHNSLLDRIEILSEPNQSSHGFEEDWFNKVSGRFAHGFIQIYLMEQYDAGKPGQSLRDVWVALIPRMFWPEKPNVTRFGAQLHNKYWQTRNARSALAPTFSAEAYWNFGIVGVLAISILVGLELGWLTNIWFRSVRGKDTAYLIVAFPAAYMGFNVEAWVAASYFGGFITLIVIWLSLKILLYHMESNNLPRLH